MRKALSSSDLALDEPRRLAFAQKGERALDEIERLLRLLVGAAYPLLERGDALLEGFEVGEHQFGLDRLDVGDRVDAALDMGDVTILETAHHMGDGVDLADIGEELIAEAFALRGAAHEAGDIDEGEARRNDFRRSRDRGQRGEPRVGHGDLAHIRLDRAERVVRRLRRRGLRQRVEERRFADIRQADDAAFEAHEPVPSSLEWCEQAQRARLARITCAPSPQPFACMARCTLFWKLASSPLHEKRARIARKPR